MADIQKTLQILDTLIAFPTVSSDPNRALIDYVSDYLSDCGAKVERVQNDDGSKANIFATIGPDISGGLVLSGHTDVVPTEGQNWSSDPFKLRHSEDGAKVFGRGTCDMKGFIACAMAIAPELAKRRLKRPMHFAFTYDEETGCLGARKLIAHLEKRETKPATAIIGEPTMMKIIEGHKGCNEYTTEFHGLEGHSSRPDLGVNALEYATRFITRLLDLRADLMARAPEGCAFVPPFSTVGLGKLESGTIHNVIPHYAELFWEMRPVQRADADFVKSQLKAYCEHDLLPAMRAVYPEAAIKTTVVGEVDGLEPTSENEARDIILELTGQNSVDLTSYGTEAGLFQNMGLSAVVCGPGSIEQAHKADEYVDTRQLQDCLALLGRLMNKVS